MATCNGRGANGSHCCYINGKECPLLEVGPLGRPSCSVWGKWDSQPYLSSAIAESFATHHPGMNCSDWPQNIPEVMAQADELGPFALCCWGRGNRGNMG